MGYSKSVTPVLSRMWILGVEDRIYRYSVKVVE